MSDVFDQHFPDVADADNPLVWCERCQRHHKKYTFTAADYAELMNHNVQQLADAINARVVEHMMKTYQS